MRVKCTIGGCYPSAPTRAKRGSLLPWWSKEEPHKPVACFFVFLFFVLRIKYSRCPYFHHRRLTHNSQSAVSNYIVITVMCTVFTAPAYKIPLLLSLHFFSISIGEGKPPSSVLMRCKHRLTVDGDTEH